MTGDRDAAIRVARRTATEQGLPARIVDPLTLDRVAQLLLDPDQPPARPGESVPARTNSGPHDRAASHCEICGSPVPPGGRRGAGTHQCRTVIDDPQQGAA